MKLTENNVVIVVVIFKVNLAHNTEWVVVTGREEQFFLGDARAVPVRGKEKFLLKLDCLDQCAAYSLYEKKFDIWCFT